MSERRITDDEDIGDDVLERSLAELRAAPVPDGPPAGVVAETLAALREAEGADRFHLNIRRNKTMRYLTRIAAGLVLAVGTAAMIFLAGKTSSVALAEVVQKVRDAKTLTYTMTSTPEGGGESQVIKYQQLGDGRRRAELTMGMISIVDPRAGKTLLLNPITKTAFIGEFKAPADGLRFDPVERLKQLRGAGAKDLGVKEVGGRKLRGFVSTTATPEVTVWADAKSGSPVSVEFTVPVAGEWSKLVMSDFVFDAKLDEGLFSADVPTGYERYNREGVRVAKGVAKERDPERHVIEALRGYAKLDGGKFPAALDDWAAYATRIGEDGDDDSRLMGHVGAITPFLLSLPRDAWAYLGDGKTLGDKDAVVFWYRRPNGTHRAVYGDLSIRTVKREELPGPAREHAPGK